MPNDPVNLSDKFGSNLSDADANLQLLKEQAAQSQGAGSSQLEIEKLKLQADKVEPEHAKLELQADRAEVKAEKLEFEAGKGGSKCTDHELEAAKAKLKADRLELEAEKTQLRVALAQLKASQSQLEHAKSQLEKLETARSYLEAAEAQADIDKLEDEKAKLRIKASQLEADKSKLEAAKSQFELSRFGLTFVYKGALAVFIIGELALVAYGRARMGRLLDLLTHAQSLAEPAITLLYPLYGSVIAIESTSKVDDEQWLAYWILYSILTLMEMVLQPILEWIPVWYMDTMKLIFSAWLVLPQFRGAAFIYDTFVRQHLKKYAWFGCGPQHKSPNGKGRT
uniref:HVA22-like protein n=1 Tax=Kalanchoe fedtschenkoi TaxID=63787 RepID=A0A7N0RAL9_KALFE